MKVELISYSNLGEKVCGIASKTCVSESIPNVDNDVTRSLKTAIVSGHTSVLEHWTATFSIEGISRACSHQLVRHRLASYSQQSQRYVKMEGFDYVIPKSIEQFEIGSQDDLIYFPDEAVYDGFSMQSPPQAYFKLMALIKKLYKGLVDRGIPEEDARYILPNACTTNIVVSMNARELRHFFALRCCARAQAEIRELANLMLDQVKAVAPILFEGAGPSCKATGRCPEGANSCGRYMRDE